MTPQMIQAVKELGLSAVLTLSILALTVWLVRYIVIKLAKEIERNTENQDRVRIALEQHEKSAAEAHKYQRDEHIEMINNLKEQGMVLARINGYKKD